MFRQNSSILIKSSLGYTRLVWGDLKLIFAVYGFWEGLAACKILLRGVPMICLQFWKFSKMTQHREV